MKNIKYFIIILMVSVSCHDRLNLENPNVQTTDQFWETQNHALDACNAMYNTLITDGMYMRMFPALMDGRGDDFRGDSPWADLVQVANFTIPQTSGPVAWIWGQHYQLIWRANQVLANVEDIEMDEELKERIFGQAYFLRGLAYFNLANFYKTVPVITEPPLDPSEYYPETAPEEVLWDQIISDFSAAKTRLPISYNDVQGPDNGDVGRATRGAATGMLGKAYLYRQRWSEASNEFGEIINGQHGPYSLVPNYRDNFDFRTGNNAESLFEVQFASPDQVGGSLLNWAGDPNGNWQQVSAQAVTYGAPGYGFNDFMPTRWLYDEFTQERTVDGGLDPRLFATVASYEPDEGRVTIYNDPWPYGEDDIFPRKYTNDGFGPSDDNGIRSGINYRVLRYAEVLMMQAEAQNELGNTALAYDLVQQVRSRANLPDLRDTAPNMSQNEMRDRIARERALEFAVEGIRINDIIRWGWLYDNEKLQMLISHDPEFATWTPGNEYLPIPQNELDVNPNLSPNPAND